MPKKLSKKDILDRFPEKEEIIVCLDDYKGWKKKSKFYDKIEKDYFWAMPRNVYQRKSIHPKRRSRLAKEKRKETCLKLWGVEHSFQAKEVKNHIKETNIKKYGVEHNSQSKEIQNKKTNTYIKKYGVDNPGLLSKKRIKETQETLFDWLERQKSPKPAYTTLLDKYALILEISQNDLEEYLQKFRNYKTNLEICGEKLLGLKHYNKKPKRINKLYRPDFKISNTIYVNVDGLYWHSEKQKHNDYHHSLYEHFENCGLQLFQFRENEIHENPNIIKSILTKKEFDINSIESFELKYLCKNVAKKFLCQNSLKTIEKNDSVIYKALIQDNKIVSILTYCKYKNFNIVHDFCCPGVLNKKTKADIWKILTKKEQKRFFIWIDLRKELDFCKTTKDFILIKEKINWEWTDGQKTYLKYPKKKNAYKIYDAGNRLYLSQIN